MNRFMIDQTTGHRVTTAYNQATNQHKITCQCGAEYKLSLDQFASDLDARDAVADWYADHLEAQHARNAAAAVPPQGFSAPLRDRLEVAVDTMTAHPVFHDAAERAAHLKAEREATQRAMDAPTVSAPSGMGYWSWEPTQGAAPLKADREALNAIMAVGASPDLVAAVLEGLKRHREAQA